MFWIGLGIGAMTGAFIGVLVISIFISGRDD